MNKLLYFKPTNNDCDFERISRLQNMMYHRKATLCYERAEIYTRVYKETENEPMIIRRAKAYKAYLEEMTIYIEPDSIIVGNQACRNFAAPIFPEYSIKWIVEEMDEFDKRSGDAFYVDDETKKRILAIAPYWKDKTHQDKVLAELSQTNRLAEEQGVLHRGGISMSGDGHIAPNFEYVFENGLGGLRDIAKKHLKDDKDLRQDQIDFYNAVIIAMDASLNYCKRFSKLAKQLADKENNEKRKNELLEISKMMSTLLEGRVNTFYEAVETVYLLHLFMMIESNGHSVNHGRFDQYMYPYYETEIKAGTLTKEKALEIITHFFIMTNSLNKIRPWDHTQYSCGYPLYSNLMIGGCKVDGSDGTNDLSYLCLEAMALNGLPEPNLATRYSKDTPHEYMKTVAKLIRRGFGMPSVFTDEACIPALQSIGIPLEVCREYATMGCVEIGIPGRYNHRCTGMTYVNFGKILELVMYNGTDPNTGIQLVKINGKDGKKIEYKSYDEVFTAWEKLLEFYSDLAVECDNICDKYLAYYDADPFASSLINYSLDRGMTLKTGGAEYDFISGSNIGPSVVGDSLAAVKKLVFEDKVLTLDELQHAMETNFEGVEGLKIRKLCKNAPKFGNDNDYVDKITADVYESYLKLIPKYKTLRAGLGPKGCRYTFGTSNITSYVPNGFDVGATPDGRLATKPLNEGASPCLGADKNGPTAVINSVSKLPNEKMAAGQLLNMRLSPGSLAGEDNLEKFTNFLEALTEKNILHDQFNVVDSKTLRAAKEHPEDYPDLMVRVAGYCALFSTLMPEAQDAIIERTELEM